LGKIFGDAFLIGIRTCNSHRLAPTMMSALLERHFRPFDSWPVENEAFPGFVLRAVSSQRR